MSKQNAIDNGAIDYVGYAGFTISVFTDDDRYYAEVDNGISVADQYRLPDEAIEAAKVKIDKVIADDSKRQSAWQ